jgi:hypothetical protein
MAGFFTHNAPDYGEQNDVSPPGTPIADALRRAALIMSRTTKHLWQDPTGTLLPWTGAVGGLAKEIPAYVSDLRNRDPDTPGNSYFSASNPRAPNPDPDASLSGRYVGPNDMLAHNTVPGYIPRQEMQNLVRQDPLAGLLGPMQKPVAKSPVVDPGY